MHIYIQVYYEGMRAAGYLSLSIYIIATPTNNEHTTLYLEESIDSGCVQWISV